MTQGNRVGTGICHEVLLVTSDQLKLKTEPGTADINYNRYIGSEIHHEEIRN